MADLLTELGTWIGENATGVDLWNESSQSGNLFLNYMPDSDPSGDPTDAIVLAYNGQNEHKGNQKYKQSFLVVARGLGNETKCKAIHRWIMTRNGTSTIPTPFDLTSYHIAKVADLGYPIAFFDQEWQQEIWQFRFALIYYAR